MKRFRSYIKDLLRNACFAVSISWRANHWLFLINIFLYIFQGLMPLAIAFLAGRLLNSIVSYLATPASDNPIILYLLGLTLAQFIYNQSMRINEYVEIKLEFHTAKTVTSSLQLKFAELDHSYYESADFTKHFNKVRENIYAINRYTMRLLRVLAALVQLLATGFTLLVFNPLIALIIVAGILPLLRVEMKASSERWKLWDRIDVDWRLRWDINWQILNTRSISEIKIFKIFPYLNTLWKRYYDRSEGERVTLEKRMQLRQFGASIVESIVQFGVTLWLLLRVLQRQGFGIGDFEFYRRIVSDFSNASSRLVIGLQDVTEGGLYVKDYLDLMAMQPKVKSGQHHLPVSKVPTIEFRNVSFKYPDTDQYVLKNLTLTIQSGDDIAIVGANGAGKTTLIKLLMRFYDVTEGSILINNINLKDLDLASWHKHVGVLFQDFNYYSYFKVERSIGVGKIEAVTRRKAIRLAAQSAGANDFIEKLPQKYKTVLNKTYPNGTDLSGGQWQRIALARAFFRDAGILILDEPTSAIDAQAEYEIFKRIHKTQAEKTTIIISHRFSTVRKADKIYVIADGTIKEQGSHEDLMQIKDGTYKHMFELQAEGYR